MAWRDIFKTMYVFQYWQKASSNRTADTITSINYVGLKKKSIFSEKLKLKDTRDVFIVSRAQVSRQRSVPK